MIELILTATAVIGATCMAGVILLLAYIHWRDKRTARLWNWRYGLKSGDKVCVKVFHDTGDYVLVSDEVIEGGTQSAWLKHWGQTSLDRIYPI